MKIFRFFVNTQKGDSVAKRISNASKVIGNFVSQRISVADARRNLEIHFARSNNRQDPLKLAPFDFKLEAFFAGSFDGMNDYKDSKSTVHLKDFVTVGMNKIDNADMSGELSPEYVKTAVFNVVKIITILSGAEWVDTFKEFTEWATHHNNDEYQQGPAAYAGPLRFYFARFIFNVVMTTLAGNLSEPASTLLEVQVQVKRRIHRRFEEYSDDNNYLKDKMLHSLNMHKRTSTLRLVSAAKPGTDKQPGSDRKVISARDDKVVSGGGERGGGFREQAGGGSDRGGRERDCDRGRRLDRSRDRGRRGLPRHTK